MNWLKRVQVDFYYREVTDRKRQIYLQTPVSRVGEFDDEVEEKIDDGLGDEDNDADEYRTSDDDAEVDANDNGDESVINGNHYAYGRFEDRYC